MKIQNIRRMKGRENSGSLMAPGSMFWTPWVLINDKTEMSTASAAGLWMPLLVFQQFSELKNIVFENKTRKCY